MIRFAAPLLIAAITTTTCFAATPKKLLLIGQGPDGHPKSTHEYMAGVDVVEKCLKAVKGVECTVVKADGAWKEGPELMERADGVVLFVSEGAKWLQLESARFDALRKLARRGDGIVVLHWAMGCKDAKYIEPFVQLAGGCHGGPDRKYAVVETDLEVADPNHPILTGIGPLKVKDEFYYQLKFATPVDGIKPLLKATIDGKKETVCWVWERPGGGRSFGFSGLHFHENWKRTEYRRLVAQAALWTLKMPIPAKGLPVDVPVDDPK